METQFPKLVSQLKEVLLSGTPNAKEDAMNCLATLACYGPLILYFDLYDF